MRILITGASGFLGSHLADNLLADNHDVIGLSKDSSHENLACALRQPHFRAHGGDIRDFSSLRKLLRLEKPEVIVHLAALIPPSDEATLVRECFEVNAQGTANVLQAALAENVQKIVYASTVNVYGKPMHFPIKESHAVEPTNFYGLTKHMGEEAVRLHSENCGFGSVVLRFSGIYGPRKRAGAIYSFIKKSLEGAPLTINEAGKPWDAVFVNDAVSALVKTLRVIDQGRCQVFNIGAGYDVKPADLADRIVRLSHSRSELVPKRRGDYGLNYYDIHDLDIRKARKELGYRPRPLEDCLRMFLSAERAAGERHA